MHHNLRLQFFLTSTNDPVCQCLWGIKREKQRSSIYVQKGPHGNRIINFLGSTVGVVDKVGSVLHSDRWESNPHHQLGRLG